MAKSTQKIAADLDEFNTIEEIHGYDHLNGTALIPGEVLQVNWPDKKTTLETVILDDEKAYTLLVYKGHPVKIRLKGLVCRRVHPPA